MENANSTEGNTALASAIALLGQKELSDEEIEWLPVDAQVHYAANKETNLERARAIAVNAITKYIQDVKEEQIIANPLPFLSDVRKLSLDTDVEKWNKNCLLLSATI